MRPTPPAVLAVWAIVGLVLGWLLHPLSDRLGTPPVVTWTQVAGLVLVAAVLGYTAWATWRTLHVRRERLDPARAVNRLVFARASALVGALVGGGYLGYGLSWLGDSSESAGQRATRSGVAVLACIGVVVTALLLERACRVRADEEDDDPRASPA